MHAVCGIKKRPKTGSGRGLRGDVKTKHVQSLCDGVSLGNVWETEAGSGLSKWKMQGRNLSSTIKVSECLL